MSAGIHGTSSDWEAATNQVVPFIEYNDGPGVGGIINAPLPPADHYAAGDSFYVWAYASSDASCATILTSGSAPFACYGFQDNTQGWAFVPPGNYNGGGPMVLPQPPGPFSYFYGATVEYALELSSQQNAFYNFGSATIAQGVGYDQNGAGHSDPGSGSDPYVAMDNVLPNGDVVNRVQWANQNWYNPQDPITFVWKAWQ